MTLFNLGVNRHCKEATQNCLLLCSKRPTIFELQGTTWDRTNALREIFTGYENDKSCKNFIFGIAECFFAGNIKNKLALVNVLAVLSNSSTDNDITEQEVVYVIFTDPETHWPVLKCFHIIAPSVRQDAPGQKLILLKRSR